LLCKSCINIIERARKRCGGKYRDGFVFRMSVCCLNREEPHGLPNDHSKGNDAQNYKCDSSISGFCAIPLCCYPPQEQTHQNAEGRVDDPTVVHGPKVFALNQKRVGLADQDSYGTPINFQKI
jgi:hypothetical protein